MITPCCVQAVVLLASTSSGLGKLWGLTANSPFRTAALDFLTYRAIGAPVTVLLLVLQVGARAVSPCLFVCHLIVCCCWLSEASLFEGLGEPEACFLVLSHCFCFATLIASAAILDLPESGPQSHNDCAIASFILVLHLLQKCLACWSCVYSSCVYKLTRDSLPLEMYGACADNFLYKFHPWYDAQSHKSVSLMCCPLW